MHSYTHTPVAHPAYPQNSCWQLNTNYKQSLTFHKFPQHPRSNNPIPANTQHAPAEHFSTRKGLWVTMTTCISRSELWWLCSSQHKHIWASTPRVNYEMSEHFKHPCILRTNTTEGFVLSLSNPYCWLLSSWTLTADCYQILIPLAEGSDCRHTHTDTQLYFTKISHHRVRFNWSSHHGSDSRRYVCQIHDKPAAKPWVDEKDLDRYPQLILITLINFTLGGRWARRRLACSAMIPQSQCLASLCNTTASI